MSCTTFSVVACLLLLTETIAQNNVLQRVVLSDPKAKCLDGSAYSYYIFVGSNATSFYFNHQGGGWCQTTDECTARANSSLGSSKTWPNEMSMGDSFSGNISTNPLLYDWVLVYLPYCDGGSFTGDNENLTNVPALYYYGFGIRQAVIASLRASYGFDKATDILVGGCSAGGLSAYLHVDWYASIAPNAYSRGLPDSGFFMDGNYNRDGKADYDWRMSNLYSMMNSVAGMSAACTSQIGYKCLFAYRALPYIKTPVFALNSAYDATMGAGQCGADSGIILDWTNATTVNECGNYIRSLVKTHLAAPNGAFLDSCHHHCGEWDQIHIDGLTSPFASMLWFENGPAALPNNGYMDQNQVYPCDSCCQD